MTGPLAQLSWAAVLAGWADSFLTITDVRTLAEARILTAEGEALVPLSDLASLRGDEERQDVHAALARLARMEGYPVYFARREWQVFRLEWQLDHLDEDVDPEEPELDAYYQMQSLEWAWQGMGKPLDVPPLNPFLRSYVEAADPVAGLVLTAHDLRAWLAQQREVLGMVAGLLAAGRGQDVAVLARAFETAQVNAEAHLNLVEQECSIYQSLNLESQATVLWQKLEAYNLAVLKARQQRSGEQSQPD
ncbi:hypothetical protein E5F05_11260 [Deinococcus metallilatus]|uniref:Uncharacterized protein YgfB (UPF0149 family) n=1 Tax=Deinococcus metallilatus TaxID=1211322 RepID=A0AAJ5F5G0_9DEIO|nr:hypothetical protein [Deinococcus metallilatus]MBB5296502.1 uncharacterized protein YgfB (UPF0149 family) [Deinococcus metallilatus]QBY08466.1 hypothetical protein E5F05_11260 [Deinococcus metallilatus]RXJ11265.1 hypothetical protein ERJ73_10080 [Deinococcus metallilatus]TLK24756.1 hypothetical protein FCS05_14515 [Deinococcus metallilatus]